MTDFRLDWVSHDAAKYACETWHYSGRIPPGTAVRVGAWEGGRFIGVVVFSRGPSSSLGSAYGLAITQVCELSRVALDDHETPVTQIVSGALRMLHQRCPGIRLVVSFADPAQGHLGTIYHAGNWTYLGRTAPTRAYIDPDGRLRHERGVSRSGYSSIFGKHTLVPPRDACVAVELPGKFRYGMALDRVMRRRLSALARPYPTSLTDDSTNDGRAEAKFQKTLVNGSRIHK
jgi:hypothetical protein